MPNESCIHYTGKKLCMLGNICEGEMPCCSGKKVKREIIYKHICSICGKEFSSHANNGAYCSYECAAKKARDTKRKNYKGRKNVKTQN